MCALLSLRHRALQVKDTKTGECYRADKLLEDFIENLVKTDKSLTTERREELRKIAAQADAYECVRWAPWLTLCVPGAALPST